MGNEPRNLYEYQEFFRFKKGLAVTTIPDEPLDWDKVNIKASRDQDYFGFNYEVVDDKVTLRFPLSLEGGLYLKAEYDLYGGDAQVVFEWGYIQLGAHLVQFSGTINFNTYRENKDFEVEVAIEKISFDALLRTRSEVKVSMEQTKTYDGADVVPPTPIKIALHSKLLKKMSRGEPSEDDVSSNDILNAGDVWVQPGTSDVKKSEISDFFGYPLATTVRPDTEDRFSVDVTERGRYVIDFEEHFDMEISPILFGSFGDWFFEARAWVVRDGLEIKTFRGGKKTGNSGGTFLSTHFDHKDRFELDVDVGDKIYISTVFDTENFSTRRYKISNYSGYVNITAETMAPPSTCIGYRFKDMLNHVIKCITGYDEAVRSNILGFDGAAWNILCTNGYKLRNFDDPNSAVKISYKEIIDIIQPIWNLVIQQQTDLENNPKLRIEMYDYFFNSKRIMKINEVADYEEYHATDFTFNEIETGYTKYAEDTINSIDEFNTEQKWLLPIKTYKQKITRKSKGIASGYLIEDVRREQFKSNPSTSMSEDDEFFIICFTETEAIYEDITIQLSNVNKTITLGRPVGMLPGTRFKVTLPGGSNSAFTFTVGNRIYGTGFSGEKYEIAPAPADALAAGKLRIQLDIPTAERNEAFDVVQNLLSPETAYNLRLSPMQILLNNASMLNTGLYFKDGNETIKNTWQKNNGELVTKYTAPARWKLRDMNVPMKESDPKVLGEFQSRRFAFMPKFSSFKAELSYRDLVEIKKSYRGESESDHNFGLIAYPDKDGEFWEGVLWALEYQPKEEYCTLLLRKLRKL